MNNENYFYAQMPEIVSVLKIMFICMCTFYTSLRIAKNNMMNIKIAICFTIVIIATSFISQVITNIVNYFLGIVFIISILSCLYIIITKSKTRYAIISIIISIGINYSIFFTSIFISFWPNHFLDIKNDYINLLLISLVHITLMTILFRIRRFKDGIIFIQNKINNEYFDILIWNTSSVIVLAISLYYKLFYIDEALTIKLFFTLIFLVIIMSITIQKTLTMYYKHKMLVKDLEETKEELKSKNKEIERLEQENLDFSKISHSISHQQKSLENKLNELMMKSEVADEIDIKDRIDKISNEYHTKSKIVVELDKTGIIEIDDMLRFMQIECIKDNIEFELQLSEDIQYMVNNFIPKEKLEILLADHIKDAIIAINHSNNINRNILVRLGIIEGCYGLYIYDTGVEFDVDTLINLGKKPITTHANEGGTGMGFLNTFDTLRECKASMIINEIGEPSKDNYTKVIMFRFDKQEKFIVKSYRANEIKKIDVNNNLEIEY